MPKEPIPDIEEKLEAAFEEAGLDPDLRVDQHVERAKHIVEALKKVCFGEKDSVKAQAWGQCLDSAEEVLLDIEAYL